MLKEACIFFSFIFAQYCSAQDKFEVNLDFNLSPALELSTKNRVDFVFNTSIGLSLKKIIPLDSSSTNYLLPYIKYNSFENLFNINSNSKASSNLGSNSNIVVSKNVSIGLDFYHRIPSLKHYQLLGGVGAIAHFQTTNSSSSQFITDSDTARFSVTNASLNKTQFNYYVKMGIQRLLNIRERKFNISMNSYYYLREIVLGEFEYSEGLFQEKGEVSTKNLNLLFSLGYIF